jgi:hypothetical protein
MFRKPLVLSFKYFQYALSQQGIQSTTRIQRIQVVTTANVLCINKNLWNRRTATALDHLFTLYGIAVNRKFLETHTLAVQQRFCAMAKRAGCFGVDLNIGHDLSPVFFLPCGMKEDG